MISFISALILSHGLLIHAEPSATSYSITGDNRYDYSNSVSNTGYLGKEGHTENGDFYAGGSNGHSVIGSGAGNQGNIGHSLPSTSYSGFSPSSHNTGYASYASSNHDDFASQYQPSTHSSASFKGYSSSSTNGDSVFEGYTAGAGQGGSNINHYSSTSQKVPSYIPFTDNVAGASSTSYSSDSIPDASTFRGYSTVGGSLGYSEGDQQISDETSYAFGGNSDFPLTKHREGFFNPGKHMSDAFPSPSDMRYLRGNQGSMYHNPSTTYLMSSASSGFVPGLRAGGSNIYAPGKVTKYVNKYPSEVGSYASQNYLQRDQEADYLSSAYGKAPGAKVIIVKDSRPSAHVGQSYPSTYLSKLMGGASYKGKLSGLMGYPGHSVGHSFMSNLHNSFGSSPYSESHIPIRGYRSSGAYVPGHSSIYPAYH